MEEITGFDKTMREIFDDLHGRMDCIEDMFVKAYFGPIDGGYVWEDLFLPNGTLLKLKYKTVDYLASVSNGTIKFQGISFSPKKLLLQITGDHTLDAWKEFWVYRRTDTVYTRADRLRHEA